MYQARAVNLPQCSSLRHYSAARLDADGREALELAVVRCPFLRGYLEAAEWAGLDDDGREALGLSVAPRWGAESIASAADDCADFQAAQDEALAVYYAQGHTPEQAGHDFYLSRNRHGAGFFDHGTHPVYRELQWAARAYSSTHEEFDPASETLTTR